MNLGDHVVLPTYKYEDMAEIYYLYKAKLLVPAVGGVARDEEFSGPEEISEETEARIVVPLSREEKEKLTNADGPETPQG